MRSSSSKESPSMAYPKTLLSIAASAGGLAVFLIIASSLLIAQPIGTTVSSYFYGPDHTERFNLDIVNGNGDDVEAFKSNLISRNNSDYGLSSGKCQGGEQLCKDQTSETRDGNEISQRGRGVGNETSSGVVIEMGSGDSNNVRHEEEGANVNENAENNSTNVQKSNTTRTYLADSGIIFFFVCFFNFLSFFVIILPSICFLFVSASVVSIIPFFFLIALVFCCIYLFAVL